MRAPQDVGATGQLAPLLTEARSAYMIPQDIIDRILRETDILEVVAKVVPLKKSGASHVGLCPFHQEKTPSFNVNPERQIFKCFGCGKGGNAITFLEQTAGMTFPEAVRTLAERLGIEVPEDRRGAGQQEKEKKEREELLDTLDRAARFFTEHLQGPGGAPYRAYLQRRGLQEQVVSRFRLGAVSGSSPLAAAALEAHIPVTTLLAAGLVSQVDARRPLVADDPTSLRDFFFDRLIFPISDERGRVVGFGGRTLKEGGPKYVNSRESPVFHKSRALYGIHQARPAMARLRRVLVVEGYTDVLMAHQCGFHHTVAALGTSLTDDHVRFLRRLVDQVDLVLDGDEAGLKAARRGIDVLARGKLKARVVLLPEGQDPCDLLGESPEGAARLAALLEEGLEPVKFVIERARRSWDVDTVDGRAAAIRDCVAHARLWGLPERELMQDRIAGAFEVSRESVRAVTGSEAAPTRPGLPRRAPPPPPGPPPEPPPEAPVEVQPGERPARTGAGSASPRRGGTGPVVSAAEGIVAAFLADPSLTPGVEIAPSSLSADNPALGRIYELILDMWQSHESISQESVVDRLGDDTAARSLVDKLVSIPMDNPAKYLEGCVKTQRALELKRERECTRRRMGSVPDESEETEVLVQSHDSLLEQHRGERANQR